MLALLIKWVVFALIIMFTAWLIPGIAVENFWAALIVTVVITLINAFIKPVLSFLTLPINILTLGIFSLFLNAFLFMFAAYLVPGISVSGFWSALFGSIIISILSVVLSKI